MQSQGQPMTCFQVSIHYLKVNEYSLSNGFDRNRFDAENKVVRKRLMVIMRIRLLDKNLPFVRKFSLVNGFGMHISVKFYAISCDKTVPE